MEASSGMKMSSLLHALLYGFLWLKRELIEKSINYCEAAQHYNKSDFFQGSKPLKKVLKNLEKNYFKSPIDP